MNKKNKIVCLLLSSMMLLSFTSATISAAPKDYVAASVTAAAKEVSVKVNGKRVNFPDAKPYYEDNRVMIPVRFVSESLGAKVSYKKTTSGNRVKRTVSISLDGKNIEMDVNSSAVLVDQQIIRLDVPARLQKDRVFVPIRFVSEALGADVKWSQANRLVTITTKNTSNPSTPDENTESNNMYGDFQFKSGYTNLAKSLFVNNAKVTNGKLTFTVPKGATATHWTKDMTSTKLVAGKSYTYALGANKGSISVNLVYPGKNEQEGYTIFLDSKANTDLASKFGSVTNDAIVALATAKGIGATTLNKVIAAAKAL